MTGYLLKDKKTGYYYDFIEDDFVCIADKQCIWDNLEFVEKCQKELKDFGWNCEIKKGVLNGKKN